MTRQKPGREAAEGRGAAPVHMLRPRGALPPEPGAAVGPGGGPEMVRVNRRALRAGGCIDPDGGRSRLAEELRVVKRPLLARALAEDAAPRDRIIVVTSAVPSEGKTFTALNLALSLSLERDANVLLVDGDQAVAGASARLGLRRAPGLADLLADQPVDPREALLRTDIDRLAVMPPGTPTADLPELLGSRRMGAILNAILSGDARRLVVIDAPPLLSSSDALALASLAGQILFVIAAGATGRDAVDEALNLLRDRPHVHLLLNRARGGRAYVGYGHYGREPKVRGKGLGRSSMLALAATAGVAAAPAALARITVTPRASVGTAVTDNVNLAPRGKARSDAVLELAPGINLTGRGARTRIDADYSARQLVFARSRGANELRHNLQASARSEVVRDTAYLDLAGDIGDEFIAGSGAEPTLPYNVVGNRAARMAASVSPFLRRQLGRSGTIEARYRATRVGFDDDALADATGHSAALTLDQSARRSPFAWQAAFLADRADIDGTDEEKGFKIVSVRGGLDTSYRLNDVWRALAGFGFARLKDESLRDQERAGPFWTLGLAAAPTRRTRLLGRVGRLYGEWQADADLTWRPSPRLEIAGRYRQGLTSRFDLIRSRLAEGGAGPQATERLVASAPLLDDPIEARVPTDLSGLSGDATFLRQRFELAVTRQTGRNRLAAATYLERREADETADALVLGLDAEFARSLSRRSSIELSAGLDSTREDGGGGEDINVRLTLAWVYQLGPDASLQLGYDRYERVGGSGDDAVANTLFARLVKRF